MTDRYTTPSGFKLNPCAAKRGGVMYATGTAEPIVTDADAQASEAAVKILKGIVMCKEIKIELEDLSAEARAAVEKAQQAPPEPIFDKDMIDEMIKSLANSEIKRFTWK